jgi:transcriptional regulator with XRE-family HTH domain
MSTFHEKLKEYRERAGMMQMVLAERVGLTQSHFNHIEKGRRPPPRVETVVKMTEVLRLAPDEAEEFVELAGYSPLVLQPKIEGDTRTRPKQKQQIRGLHIIPDNKLTSSGGYDYPDTGEGEDQEAQQLATFVERLRKIYDEADLDYEDQEQAKRLIWEAVLEPALVSARAICRSLKERESEASGE